MQVPEEASSRSGTQQEEQRPQEAVSCVSLSSAWPAVFAKGSAVLRAASTSARSQAISGWHDAWLEPGVAGFAAELGMVRFPCLDRRRWRCHLQQDACQ